MFSKAFLMKVIKSRDYVVKINMTSGVEISFFCYLQKIASAMISNYLNASCYYKMKSMILFLYHCQYH